MIGLEYLLKLHRIHQSELADELMTTKQNVNLWINEKQNIPKKYLNILTEKFAVDKDYLQSKVDISGMKINNPLDVNIKGITGLSYICKIRDISYANITKIIEVTKEKFDNWCLGIEVIPQEYRNILSGHLNVSGDLLQKELVNSDKINILINEVERLS